MLGANLVQGTLVHEVSAGMVQVGSNPTHSVVFSGLSPIEVAWLRSLTDPKNQRARTGTTTYSERQVEALRMLDAAGLLTPEGNPMHKLKVRVGQMDEVGVRVAKLLAESGVAGIEIQDGGRVDVHTESLFPAECKGMPRALSVRRMVKEIAPRVCTGKVAVPDVAVVCSDRVFDHGLLGSLLSFDTVHIPVVSDDRSIVVGPLVIPGCTPCALCLDLHCRDKAPGWEKRRESLELTGAAPSSPHLATVAAGLAVGLISTVAGGGARAAWVAASQASRDWGERVAQESAASPIYRVTDTGVETHACFPHPECGCLALAKVS